MGILALQDERLTIIEGSSLKRVSKEIFKISDAFVGRLNPSISGVEISTCCVWGFFPSTDETMQSPTPKGRHAQKGYHFFLPRAVSDTSK